MNQAKRGGFTIAELVVVTVLGALVIAAALQILITNQRTYTAQTAQIQGQQASRAALDVLTNELREISAQGGDILTMDEDSVQVRVMRNFGVVCDVDTTSTPKLTVIKVGDWFEVDDSVLIFADNRTETDSDDTWINAEVTAVDTTESCSGIDAHELTFGSQSSIFSADSVRVGGSVRSYTYFTYGLFEYRGDIYLGRADTSDAMVPVVGPLKSTRGLAFEYLDTAGVATKTATDVRLIQVTLRTGGSGVLNSLGEEVSDSVTALIYTRN